MQKFTFCDSRKITQDRSDKRNLSLESGRFEVSRNLARYKSKNNFVGQNNYVETLKHNAAKSFNILATGVLHNYFDKIIFRSVFS